MTFLEELKEYADALAAAVESAPEVFVTIGGYVHRLRDSAYAARGEVTQARLAFWAKEIDRFFWDYRARPKSSDLS